MSSKISQSSKHEDGIRTPPAGLGNLTGLILETPVKPAPFSSTVAARKHVVGTQSAVMLEFVALLYVHVSVLVQTMMVETMSDVIAIFCYARQTFKSFGQIDYIILLTI